MNKPNLARESLAAPVALHSHAEDNLRFIRAAMEGATSFTGVSGKGLVIAGITALIATWVVAGQASPEAWFAVWMLELIIAGGTNLVLTVRKAAAQGGELLSGSGKKLLLAFIPVMVAGGILTLAFYLNGLIHLLPGLWLCIYGVAVITAGAYSIRLIPVMGMLFLVTGAVVLLTAVPAALTFGLAMGGMHIIFGTVIWRQHGG